MFEDLAFNIHKGSRIALVGKNGAGKSTLSYVLTGRDGYEVTSGTALLDGEDILDMEPEERAAEGLFLSFQYPTEIPGVPVMTFVRTAMNAQRKLRGEEEISAPDFIKKSREIGKALNISNDMLKRPLNVGFSGGEKKRLEIFQMMMLEPSFAILDETDSGLDIDALRTVADGVNVLRSPERGMLVITHYQRLLDYIKPDKVHVLAKGRILTTGGPELALRLEKEGYDGILSEAA
ncbi:MAG: Fe-S cluster assembly ATPase SufC [Pseudomonadota bacterium]